MGVKELNPPRSLHKGTESLLLLRAAVDYYLMASQRYEGKKLTRLETKDL